MCPVEVNNCKIDENILIMFSEQPFSSHMHDYNKTIDWKIP